MTITVTEYVDDAYTRESAVRRLIAKNLKMITGTIVYAASGSGGSAGDSFDYTDYGDRFLYMGLTPRTYGTLSSSAEAVYFPVYDPSAKKIYLFKGGGNARPFELVTQNAPLGELTIQFVLFVMDGPSTGIG